MKISNILEACISKNEQIEIIYYGGSKPGHKRKIIPRKIDGDKLQALCLETGVVKTFSISKISISLNSSTIGADPSMINEINSQTYDGLSDFLKKNKNNFEKLGWHVESDGDTFISLHGRFKNGNPKKTPDISLQFEEYYEDYVYDPDKDEFVVEVKKKQKPWCLMIKNETTRNFAILNNAFPNILKAVK